jgi:hypothetical protein
MKNIFSHKKDRFAALHINKSGLNPHEPMNRTMVQNIIHFKDSVLAEHRRMESYAAQERSTGVINVSDMLCGEKGRRRMSQRQKQLGRYQGNRPLGMK